MTPSELKAKNIISDNLNQLLHQKNLKKIDVQKATDIPRSTISDYFGGKTLPSEKNVEKLAHFFNVRPEELDPRFSTSTTQEEIHYPKKVDIKELKDKHVAMSYGGIDLTKDDFRILEAILKRNELLKDE